MCVFDERFAREDSRLCVKVDVESKCERLTGLRSPLKYRLGGYYRDQATKKSGACILHQDRYVSREATFVERLSIELCA